jgi:uncharacterized protein (TIGR02265 family)
MRIVKYSSIEAVLRAFKMEKDFELMRQVQLICGTNNRQGLTDVSVEGFVELLDFAARHFYPQMTLDEALYAVGRRVFEGYRETILGRLQFAAIKVVPPETIVKKTPENLSQNNNFGNRRCEQLDLRRYRLIFEGDPVQPSYYNGLFQAGMEATRARNPRVFSQQLGPESTEHILEWD